MTVYFPGKKKVDVAVGNFVIHTDQSVAHGGDASAPEPFTLFLASLAACAGIYVLGFCQTRGIPTEGIRLDQREEFDAQGTLSAVTIDITLPDSFPAKYRDAVVAVANKCAVKRAIAAQPKFDIRIKGAPAAEATV